MGTHLWQCMWAGLAFSGSVTITEKNMYAGERILFESRSQDSHTTQVALVDALVSDGKVDKSLVFIIKDHTAGVKPGSQAYLVAKVRGLRIFQELVRKGVDPAHIEFFPVTPPKGQDVQVQVDTKKVDDPKSTVIVTPEKGGASGEQEFTVNFPSASAEPLNLSNDRLALFVKSVGQAGNDALIIEGYADSTGNPSYNKVLSELRAFRTYEILARAGVPPYRIDTRGMGTAKVVGGKAQTEAEMQAARRVVVRWITDEKIAAIAAVEDKKVETPTIAKAPEPMPAPQALATPEPAPQETSKNDASSSQWQLIPFVGLLAPTGAFSDVTKPAIHYGLGASIDWLKRETGTVRGNLFLGHSVLPPKDSGLTGDLNLSSFSLRTDYLWSSGSIRPFLGVGLGLYLWDGAITQKASAATHEKSTTDSGASLTAGFDAKITQALTLSPELNWNKAGGSFSASFVTVNLALRWSL